MTHFYFSARSDRTPWFMTPVSKAERSYRAKQNRNSCPSLTSTATYEQTSLQMFDNVRLMRQEIWPVVMWCNPLQTLTLTPDTHRYLTHKYIDAHPGLCQLQPLGQTCTTTISASCFSGNETMSKAVRRAVLNWSPKKAHSNPNPRTHKDITLMIIHTQHFKTGQEHNRGSADRHTASWIQSGIGSLATTPSRSCKLWFSEASSKPALHRHVQHRVQVAVRL